jgi:sugar lactone lactonase YvrE
MAADAERGFLYVANGLTCDVRKFDVSGAEPKRVAILGDGVLDFPRGVAVAPDGTVYVVDSRHHRVCVFGLDGKLLSSFGGPGRAPGKFLYPWGIAVDPVSGLLFVSDPQNGRVQAFEKDGRLADWWNRFKAAEFGKKPAEEGPARVPFGSSGPPGNHDETFGLCCDARGYLYVGTGPYVARFRIARGK